MYPSYRTITLLLFLFTVILNAQEKPNVIVVLVDDLGLGDVSYYRKLHSDNIIVETPALDALAENGTVFTNAHAPAALCAPSRYAIMTGNHCYRSDAPWGVWGSYEKSPIKENQLTLAKLMKQAGYHTAFFGKWHIGGDFLRKDDPKTIYRGPRNKPELDVDIRKIVGGGPRYHGFDYALSFQAGIQDVPYAIYENSIFKPIAKNSKITFITQAKMDKIGVKLDKAEGLGDSHWNPTHMGHMLIYTAKNYIEENANKDKPFFMYYSALAVHLPHTPTDELNGMKIAGTTPSKHLDLVKELDVQIQMLINTLKEQGIYDDTIIMLTSDNGGLLRKNTLKCGHQPSDIYRGGKNQAYEGGNRVPFIISWNNHLKHQLNGSPVLGLDIMATLADLTQIDLPDDQALDSSSFLPMLKNETEVLNRTIYSQSGTRKEVMLIKDNFKLIMQVDKTDLSNNTQLPIALFDLKNNPTETEEGNLILNKEYQSKIKELATLYHTTRKSGRPTASRFLNN
ncbi:arylsulfatase [Maribacter sp. M208]|uniref:sulfatase family protein n=1 Tax=Maribacter huludaoensis TaxID=3030010 RepID=UPI0023EDF75E|nr:arylsulfatase [Maribacter huludaoensis]MDF4222572.1 arylsulfatase [Maribacter huludaoensis]